MRRIGRSSSQWSTPAVTPAGATRWGSCGRTRWHRGLAAWAWASDRGSYSRSWALLLAAVAIGVGGSRQPSVVVPDTSPTTSPSASPTQFASPSGPASAGILVELVVAAGQPQTVDVIDESGKLVEASSGSPTGDGQSFPDDDVEVTNIDATTLQLGWAGFPCRTDHDLLIGT